MRIKPITLNSLHTIVSVAFVFIATGLNASTIIDSISFTRNNQQAYSSSGLAWNGQDDFLGAQGQSLDPSYYSQYHLGGASQATMDGSGHLVYTGPSSDVMCPSFNAQGTPLPVRGSTGIINFLSPQTMHDE